MKGTVCGYCNKDFTKPAKLKRHLVVHTGERPYLCKFCPKNYNDKSALIRHIRAKHKVTRETVSETQMKNQQSIKPPPELYTVKYINIIPKTEPSPDATE